MTHGPSGFAVTPEDMHNSPFDLDYEEEVVTTQQHRVDGEEVGGQNPFGLHPEELHPGWSGSPWCRQEPVVRQHLGHGALRDPDTQLLELTDDPQIAPAGIVSGQREDQLGCLLRQRRTSWSAMRVGPVPADERPVPAHDRTWADQERRPALTGHQLSQA